MDLTNVEAIDILRLDGRPKSQKVKARLIGLGAMQPKLSNWLLRRTDIPQKVSVRLFELRLQLLIEASEPCETDAEVSGLREALRGASSHIDYLRNPVKRLEGDLSKYKKGVASAAAAYRSELIKI